jgi:hypothetical protein
MLAGSTSSLTAMTIFPQLDCKVAVPCSARHTSLRGVETLLGYVEKDNPKAKTADPKSFYDDNILREIEASGFVKTLYQR